MLVWVLNGFMTMGLPLMLTKPIIVCKYQENDIIYEKNCDFT